jgi:hypothetical protein
MKQSLYFVLAVFALVFSANNAISQSPGGATCLEAQPLSIPSTLTVFNEDNWFTLSPTEDIQVVIQTCGLSSCDTRLWLYSACPPVTSETQNLIAQNDDGCGMQSTLTVALITGQTYYLRVGDFANACTIPITFSINYDIIIPGCTNPVASNFNPEATDDDGSCIIEGCTNSNALNYNPAANSDDGSCELCEGEGAFVGTLYLCTFSNDYQVELTINNSAGEQVAYLSGLTGGAIQYVDICLVPGECYSAIMHNNTGPNGWFNGYFWVNGNGVQYINDGLQAGNQTEIVQFSVDGTCGPISGCLDPNAVNYNPAAQISGEPCYYEGCTDPNALNFDAYANLDDGSCEYCTGDNMVQATLYVCTYSNGNQVELQILNENGEEVAYVNNLSNGAIEYITLCLDVTQCYTVNMINNQGPFGWYGGYFWINYNGIQIINNQLPQGMEVLGTVFSLNGVCGPVLNFGCTDPQAINYDPTATVFDGSCIYPIYGCMDPLALNYNEEANFNYDCFYAQDCFMNLVEFELVGSTWPNEASYIVYTQGGIYSTSGYSGVTYSCLPDGCYQIALYDSFGDGWDSGELNIYVNGELAGTFNMFSGSYSEVAFGINSDCELTILGCTDINAVNYNPFANVDDGSCVTYDMCQDNLVQVSISTEMWGSEVSWMIINENFEPVMEGSDYASYSDYNYYGCLPSGCYEMILLDSWGDGWNGATYSVSYSGGSYFGTLEVGSDESETIGINSMCSDVYGCTDSAALNYDPNATFDDGSCWYNDNDGDSSNSGDPSGMGMTVYPNPFGSEVNIQIEGLMPNVETRIQLHSTDGRLVYSEKINNAESNYRYTLSTENLAAGFYILQVQNNGQNMNKSVIKQ